MARALQHEGWEPPRIGKAGLAACLGTGVHAGLATYNESRKAEQEGGEAVDPKARLAASVAAGELAIQREQERWASRGQIVADYDQAQLKALVPRTQRAIARYVEQEPIPPSWRILDVERTLPDYGNCRMDLGLDDGSGPVPLDYKVKLTLDARYRGKTIDEYRRSFAMLQYAEGYAAYLGRAVTRYIVCVLVLEPKFEVLWLPYPIHPERRELWLVSSRQAWTDMEAEDAGERVPTMNPEACGSYAGCGYARACWEFHLDEQLMTHEYRRRT